MFNDLTRISGDANDGIYEVTKTLPSGHAAGEWVLSNTLMRDQLNNLEFRGADYYDNHDNDENFM